MNAPVGLPALLQPDRLVGTWRRFGQYGPIYEILAVTVTDETETARVRVQVIESGEQLHYPLEAVLQDPVER